MNLCGGITNVAEQELFLSIPDDDITLTPRRKKSSSTPSRRKKSLSSQRDTSPLSSSKRMPPESMGNAQSRSSSSSRTGSMSARTKINNNPIDKSSNNMLNPVSREDLKLLNPVSREDFKKYRSRQRGHPLRGMKSSSILMKKLESGFNLVSSALLEELWWPCFTVRDSI
jgi:hypothetical protein